MPDTDSLLADVRPVEAGPPNRWPRRAGLAVLLVIVILGALGVFGVHSRSTSATRNGYTLAVTYPQSARAGLDVPLRIRVHRDQPIADAFTLAVSAEYFRLFETQGTYPDPDSSTNDGRFVYYTFSPRSGSNDFLVDFDVYIQPSSQVGKSALVKLIVGGDEAAQVSLRTWLVP